MLENPGEATAPIAPAADAHECVMKRTKGRFKQLPNTTKSRPDSSC